LGAIHASRGSGNTAEDVSAANDYGNLDAILPSWTYVFCYALQYGRIDTVVLRAHERFARQLEQDSFVTMTRHSASLEVFNLT
jgi:hypothetical protein